MLLTLTCDGFIILNELTHFSQFSYIATIHRPYSDFTNFYMHLCVPEYVQVFHAVLSYA